MTAVSFAISTATCANLPVLEQFNRTRSTWSGGIKPVLADHPIGSRPDLPTCACSAQLRTAGYQIRRNRDNQEELGREALVKWLREAMRPADLRDAAQNAGGGDTPPSTILGADIRIVGTIEGSADLVIRGDVDADIRCRTLTLGARASVTGKVQAERAHIAGAVNGSIQTQDLNVAGTGVVTGDAIYSRINVAAGGVMEGSLKCSHAPEDTGRKRQ